MTIYKCAKCGNQLILSSKPSQCESCGSKQFKSLGRNASKTVLSKLESQPSNPPPSPKSGKSPPSRMLSPQEPSATLFQGEPSSIRIKGDFTQVNPPLKNRKKSDEPSLPLYSGPSNLPIPASPLKKSPQAPNKAQKPFIFGRKWLISLVVLLLGGLGYKVWQDKIFDTSDFQRTTLKETFNRPRGWFLTRGADLKNGGLFHVQPYKNHYGASRWLGKNFAAVDFSSDVKKAAGPNNVPFGIIAQINGTSHERFYYLLIDGQGRFSLGKHDKKNWNSKVGWKKSNTINPGNTKNNLRIVYKDNLVIGFINGQKVGSFRDEDYKSGKIGVFSMRGTGAPVAVYFYNIKALERPTNSSSESSPKLLAES